MPLPKDIARVSDDIADLLEIQGENAIRTATSRCSSSRADACSVSARRAILDMAAVRAARDRGCLLELDAQPDRLDLDDSARGMARDAQAVRRRIGYVSQMLSADGELTGYENLLPGGETARHRTP